MRWRSGSARVKQCVEPRGEAVSPLSWPHVGAVIGTMVIVSLGGESQQPVSCLPTGLTGSHIGCSPSVGRHRITLALVSSSPGQRRGVRGERLRLSPAWIGIDDQRAAVTINAGGQPVDIDVAVDNDGRLARLGLQRWNGSTKPPDFAAFGGSVHSLHTTDSGVAIAGSGIVGWEWSTPRQADGEFFRHTIASAHSL